MTSYLRSAYGDVWNIIYPRQYVAPWTRFNALGKSLFIWRIELEQWDNVREWAIARGFTRLFVSLSRRSRNLIATQNANAPYNVSSNMSLGDVRSHFPPHPGVEYYGLIGGDPAWYRKEWEKSAELGQTGGTSSSGFEAAGEFPEDAPIVVHHWVRIQELYGVLHGIVVDFEPHVIPTFSPSSEPYIEYNNHWYWRDDDSRWVGSPTDAKKRELRRRWAQNSLTTATHIRSAIRRRSWLGGTPFIAVTATPFAVRTMEGSTIVKTQGFESQYWPWHPNGEANFYAEYCKVPDETILMAYRSSVPEILEATELCREIQQSISNIAPITFALTTQAGTPTADDPAAVAIRNGAFFMSGGGFPRFFLDLYDTLQEQPSSLKWSGKMAVHQYKNLLHLQQPS